MQIISQQLRTTTSSLAPAPASNSVSIAAVLLLAGGVTPSPLRRLSGRPSAELPVAPGVTLLDCWVEQVGKLAGFKAMDSVPPLRLLLDGESPVPSISANASKYVRVMQDAGEIRGAGGALRDSTLDLDPESYVLAAPASQLLVRPLPRIVEAMAESAKQSGRRCDAVLAANADGTPGSILLAKVGALRRIPSVGFIDLKEQALPLLAKDGDVRAVRFEQTMALSARTPTEYLRALRFLAAGADEPWRASFSLVESGAEVDETATLHDSVVLSSASVGKDAVLVRCLVCPGAIVEAKAVVVDQVITRGSTSVAPRKGPRAKEMAA